MTSAGSMGKATAPPQRPEAPYPRASSPDPDDASPLQRVVQRVYRACGRGFVIGFALRGGLHAVSSAVQAARGQKLSHGARHQAWDSLRWAAALATFGSIYVAADEGIRTTVGSHRSAHWRAAVAGALAGPSILLTGARTRHDELALYFLLRGVTLLVRCGNKAPPGGALRAALAPTRWRDGDAVMMCAATWQILFAYIMVPQSLPRGYIRFLDRMAGFQSWLVPVVRELALRNVGRPPHDAALLASLPPQHAPAVADSDFCGLLHPSHPGRCNTHFAAILPTLFVKSLMVYLPVYVASAVAVHREQIVKRRAAVAPKLLLGTARSSAFLAVYVACAHRVVCWANRLNAFGMRGLTPARIALVAWAPGLAVLLEKKSRRMELALYCSCRALLSAYQALLGHAAAPRWLRAARTDVVTFAAAMAAVMHCYSDSYGANRDIFRSKYLNVLDFVLGGRGLDTGRISHTASNRELILQASVATRQRLRTISQHNLQTLLPQSLRAAGM